jgi:hypothetical protein
MARVGLDTLSTHLVELACTRVADGGGFAPFGGCIGPDGKILLLEGDPAAIAEQIRSLGSEIGMILTDERDCILFATENSRGVIVRGRLPYTRTDDEVTFGEYFISPLPAY